MSWYDLVDNTQVEVTYLPQAQVKIGFSFKLIFYLLENCRVFFDYKATVFMSIYVIFVHLRNCDKSSPRGK